jgi:hypothetical protein
MKSPEVDMATIIRFPAEAAAWRAQTRALAPFEPGRRGDILMFTGVRYERGEKLSGTNRDDKPGKRRRRAKV